MCCVRNLAGRRPFHHPRTGVPSGVWPDAGRSTTQGPGYRPGFGRTPAVPPPKDRGTVRGLAGRRLFRYPGGENGGELNRPGTVTEKAYSTHLLTLATNNVAVNFNEEEGVGRMMDINDTPYSDAWGRAEIILRPVILRWWHRGWFSPD